MRKAKASKFSDFELGMLCGAAIIARHGEDTLCVELLGAIGVHTVSDIRCRGLEAYDREALVRVLRLKNA